jgi:hypothetical protein
MARLGRSIGSRQAMGSLKVLERAVDHVGTRSRFFKAAVGVNGVRTRIPVEPTSLRGQNVHDTSHESRLVASNLKDEAG